MDAWADSCAIVDNSVVFDDSVAPLPQMYSSAIHLRIVTLYQISFDNGIASLEANNSATVAVVVDVRVVRVGVVKAVFYESEIIGEGVVTDNRTDMHRRVRGVVWVYGVTIDVDTAALTCDIFGKDIFADSWCGHIVAEDAAAAAVPSQALKLPGY
ncbi:hypothetical protein ES703_72951 [subsurface metagenome]